MTGIAALAAAAAASQKIQGTSQTICSIVSCEIFHFRQLVDR